MARMMLSRICSTPAASKKVNSHIDVSPFYTYNITPEGAKVKAASVKGMSTTRLTFVGSNTEPDPGVESKPKKANSFIYLAVLCVCVGPQVMALSC